MRLKTQRKMIYATMGLTVLALVGGFAAAALTAPGNTSNQNGFSFTAPGNTIYSGTTPTENLAFTTPSSCTAGGGTVTAPGAATSSSVYVAGQVACLGGADWFEDFSFTSNAVGGATAPSDTFAISCGTFATVTVTVAYTGLVGADHVTTDIFYEVGTSGSSVACAISVNGS